MRLPLCTLLAATLLTTLPAQAQQPTGSPGGVRASVDGEFGVQRLSGATLGTLSARLWLHLGDVWRVGFGGVRGLNRSAGGTLESSGLEASFGLATVTVARSLPLLEGLEVSASLGSGAVSLENALLGTTLDTETVWALEPGLNWRLGTLGPVDLGVHAGYRWIFGSEGLSRLDASDLDTFTLGLRLLFNRL